MIVHDETLERTAGRDLRVDALTADALAAVRADRGFRGTRVQQDRECSIPSLAALLERCMLRGLCVNLELKAPAADPAGLVAAVALCLSRAPQGWAAAHVLISSFDAGLVAQSQDQLPKIPRALLCEAVADAELATARQLGCSALNMGDRGCTPEVISAAAAAGMAVLAWTVNRPQRAHTLLADGVCCVITDRMDLASRQAGRRAGHGPAD